jgi:ankyrin repeat protein
MILSLVRKSAFWGTLVIATPAAWPALSQPSYRFFLNDKGEMFISAPGVAAAAADIALTADALKEELAAQIAHRGLCREGHYLLSLGTLNGLTLRARCVDSHHREDDAFWQTLSASAEPSAVRAQILEAVARHFPRSLERLLERDPDAVKDFEAQGNSLIVRALAYPAPSWPQQVTVEVLLRAGAAINVPDRRGATPLHLFASSLPTIEPAETRPVAGGRAILIPVAENPAAADLLEVLLRAGADPNADGPGYTPFHTVAKRGWLSLVTRMIEHGAKVDAVDRNGRTALWEARHPVFALLLQHKGNINHVDQKGETVLFQLVRDRQPDSIERLALAVEAGANVRHRNASGITALTLLTTDSWELMAKGERIFGTGQDATMQLAKRRILETPRTKR